MAEGTKYDQNKPMFDLVDPLAIEGLAKILTFGAQKYAANNWRGGIAYSRIIASLERHLNAFKRGEEIDPESGLPHIDHLGCNWMFLSYFTKQRRDLDDRWSGWSNVSSNANVGCTPSKPLTREEYYEQTVNLSSQPVQHWDRFQGGSVQEGLCPSSKADAAGQLSLLPDCTFPPNRSGGDDQD